MTKGQLRNSILRIVLIRLPFFRKKWKKLGNLCIIFYLNESCRNTLSVNTFYVRIMSLEEIGSEHFTISLFYTDRIFWISPRNDILTSVSRALKHDFHSVLCLFDVKFSKFHRTTFFDHSSAQRLSKCLVIADDVLRLKEFPKA